MGIPQQNDINPKVGAGTLGAGTLGAGTVQRYTHSGPSFTGPSKLVPREIRIPGFEIRTCFKFTWRGLKPNSAWPRTFY